MKIIWRQIQIAVCIFSICFQAFAEPGLCPQVFIDHKVLESPSLIQKILLPQALLAFDANLYWQVRTAELSALHLSKDELKRVEVKMALLDRLLPVSGEKWIDKIHSTSSLRAREMNALISRYTLSELQDPYLRKQFITQLYLLKETPWLGFKKSIEISKNENLQNWLQRGLDKHLLNYGLKSALKEFGLAKPTQLEMARLYLKKALAGGWLNLPRSLPVISANLDNTAMEAMLWDGVKPHDKALQQLMKKDHLIENYNQFARVYQRVGTIIMVALVFYLYPQMQEKFEKELQEKEEALANSPEKIKERDQAFANAMRSLDQIDKSLDEMASQNPKQQMYEETLLLFESVNKRPATSDELQQLRTKIGL